MNLNQLKYFYKVCICGSLSEAAEHLYISQPSLSSAIKSLESEFGIVLFSRTHSGMQLTPEGKILFESCKDLLSHTEQVENIMKDLGNKRNKLRLGIPPMIGSLITPKIYRDFCRLYPDIRLEITEDGRSELLYKLSENLLDIVFLLRNNALDKTFSSSVIGNMEIVCCASMEHPIARYKAVTPEILMDVPLVLFENSFFQTEKIKKWFASESVDPNIIMQTKQLSTMLSMISQNVAAGFTFREIAQTEKSFVAIPCETPISADVCIVWNKSSYNFNNMEKFKSYIRDKNPLTAIKNENN